MANTTLTADIIAAEAVGILENNCVMGGLVYRGYEEEFSKRINGYTVGETISVRRPADFTVRSGPTVEIQDVVEGKLNVTVDQQKGVDFKFSSSDLTLQIKDLSERIIKPAMIKLANEIDRDLTSLYKDVWNWVGTPGQTVDSFKDFALAPERLDLGAVPQDNRSSVLSPSDQWGMLGSQTALYMQDVAKDAYRRGRLGMIGNVDTYSSQNVQAHTVGAAATTSAVADAPAGNGVLSTTWEATKDTGYMYLSTDGWSSSSLNKGDVLELSDVYAVNPVTKAKLAHKQQFVVLEDTATSSGDTAIKISPPIITSGAHQTVDKAPTDGTTTIAKVGTGGTAYPQNLVFHKNAFSLVMVPMVRPPGAVDVSRKSYKGYSVRVIPFYDGTNDVSSWRLDVLYGVKTVDPRLATRLSGTASA